MVSGLLELTRGSGFCRGTRRPLDVAGGSGPPRAKSLLSLSLGGVEVQCVNTVGARSRAGGTAAGLCGGEATC